MKKEMKKLLKNKSIDLLDLVGKIDLVSMYHIMKKVAYLLETILD